MKLFYLKNQAFSTVMLVGKLSNIFQENTYHNILKMIEPFMLVYPFNSTSTNMPCFGNRTKMLFTCWWQGEEEAPDLIRACIRSQKRNIPKEIRHVVISKYNYGEYIDIPDFVLQKVESGKISLTTLSDIIRVSLLYKWGGGWIDSTVLLTHMIDVNIFNYPFYTRNIPEKQYCTNIVWSDWFIGIETEHYLSHFRFHLFYLAIQ